MRRLVRWRDRDERGAIIPIVALLLVVLIPSSAMAVDLGMQRVVRRDVQGLADLVALDVVRLVDGRAAAQIQAGSNGQPSLAAAIARSVARNEEDVLGNPPVVTAKLVHIDTATGIVETVTGGAPREVTGTEVPNAVEITARGSVDFAFVPGRGPAVRTSIAVPSPTSCFRLGSFAAGVDTTQAQLLNRLLPGLLNLSSLSATVAGYQGLATAQVSLLDLVSVPALGVGTPEELLQLDAVRVADLYAAMATVLQRRGGATVALTLLQDLATRANLTSTIAIADLLDIETAGTAALAAQFNVLDLVTGAAYLANGSNTLLIPSLALQLPILNTGAVVSLAVGEAPKLVCGQVGKATASTGQVDLNVAGTIADTTLNLGLGAFTVQTSVSSRVFLAAAEGTLTDIRCGDATAVTNAEGIDVSVTSGLASVLSVGANIRIRATLNLLVGVVTVDVTVPATTSTFGGMSTGTVPFRHPPDSYSVGKRHGSSVVVPQLANPGVPAGLKVRIKPLVGPAYEADLGSVLGLGAALGTVLSTVVGTVNSGLVAQLNTSLAPQLASQLGVTVGGADVFAMPRPSCQDPGLAG